MQHVLRVCGHKAQRHVIHWFGELLMERESRTPEPNKTPIDPAVKNTARNFKSPLSQIQRSSMCRCDLQDKGHVQYMQRIQTASIVKWITKGLIENIAARATELDQGHGLVSFAWLEAIPQPFRRRFPVSSSLSEAQTRLFRRESHVASAMRLAMFVREARILREGL